MAESASLDPLLRELRRCRLCAPSLEPRPVVQASPASRILVAGQAPGRRVHASGLPFDDPSGERLRSWMGIDEADFRDPGKVAVLPMAFCYPGTGRSGDHPPPPICAATWRKPLLAELRDIRLVLVIGRHALAWHLPYLAKSLTDAVRRWRECGPGVLPLPHPSPRNMRWMARNPWFEAEIVPEVARRVRLALS